MVRSKKVVAHFNKSRPHHEELQGKQEMLQLDNQANTGNDKCTIIMIILHTILYCFSGCSSQMELSL